MEGQKWKNRIRFVEYDANGKVECETKYSNLKPLIDSLVGEGNKIKRIHCKSTPIDKATKATNIPGVKIFGDLFYHHLIEIRTQSGDCYSLEKVILNGVW